MYRTREWLVAGGLLLAALATHAGEPGQTPAGTPSEGATDPVAALFATATPVTDAALGNLTGKAQIQVDKIQVNDQDLTGVVTDNVAIDNQTGHNTISEGAYTSSAGFMTTIQNTGNNVLIQNATIVNLTVEP